MRISTAFPSKYLRADDLQGHEPTVVIDRIVTEEIGADEQQKPVIYFRGKERGLVLNKTNATNISLAFGDETDQWIGKSVVLFVAWVDYQGRSVQAIRVRPPQPASPEVDPQAPIEDEAPF